MELDDFKYRKDNTSGKEGKIIGADIDTIMIRLREHFNKQKRTGLYFAIVNICLAVIYISLLEKGAFLLNIGLTLISAGLGLGSLYLFIKSNQISDSLYSLPVLSFLTGAEKRLVFMKLADWLIVVPLLILIGAGGGIFFTTRIMQYTSRIELVISIWVIFFIGLSLFGFRASRKNWDREQGNLLDEVRKIRNNLTDMDV